MQANEKLSNNFTFGELTNTKERDLLDQNRREAVAHLDAGRAIAAMLQVVRDHYGKPLNVHSGYRCRALNSRIGGSPSSQHMLFQAADFHVEGVTLQAVFDWIRKESGLAYGQVILEGRTPGKPSWVHLSLGEPWRTQGTREAMIFDGKRYTRVVA